MFEERIAAMLRRVPAWKISPMRHSGSWIKPRSSDLLLVHT